MKMDLLDNDFIAAAVLAADLEAFSSAPTTPRMRVEDTNTFDPQAWNAARIHGSKELQHAAVRYLLREIRIHLNKGVDEEAILDTLENTYQALGLYGKPFNARRKLRKLIELSHGWDYHKNTVVVLDSLIYWTHVALNSKKVQKESKKLMPFMLTLAALFCMKDCNPKAILSTRITRTVGASASLSTIDLDVSKQKRKWLAYEKLGAIKFYVGAKGGDSNRVEILPAKDLLTPAQKQVAVEAILSLVQHEGIQEPLRIVLNALAASEDAPHYGNTDLYNQAENLISAFKPLADALIHDRKAERLVDSVAFEQVLADAAQELTEKVTAFYQAGKTLVKSPQIHAKPQTLTEVPVLEEPDNEPVKTDGWADGVLDLHEPATNNVRYVRRIRKVVTAESVLSNRAPSYMEKMSAGLDW